jgi:cysteine desulfurase/selenocysteine lyase
VRGTIRQFLGARHEEEIVFTTGSTMGINLVSYGWAAPNLAPGDEIVLSVMEHHANVVPWHFLRERQGAVLRWVEIEPDGSLDPQKVIDAIGPRTRLVAVTHMSNVLGTVVDVKTICTAARAMGVPVLVDGSQAAVHMAVDVSEIGCDFYVVTGHKLYGPTGIGVLYGKHAHLEAMPPFNGGGEMIREVFEDRVTYGEPPHKFEAGTPPIAAAIGLGATVDYLESVGLDRIAAHEHDLLTYATEAFTRLKGVRIVGTARNKAAVLSFTLQGVHPHDVGTILNEDGVAVRTGHHCAQPVMQRFGIPATARASFYLYNTFADVDALVAGIRRVQKIFG